MARESDAAAARARVVEVASQVLDGLLSPILAARELLGLMVQLGVPREDPDFATFVLIESVTDALPLGPERREWAPDALERKAVDVARSERWARETGNDAFQSVVRRWGAA